jgi:hypothetical protein
MFFVSDWLIIMIGHVVCYSPICCPNFNFIIAKNHSDDILGARMLWKPKEARILKNFIDQPV